MEISELYEMDKMYSREYVYSLIDYMIDEFEKTINFPYKIETSKGNLLIYEDGRIERHYRNI